MELKLSPTVRAVVYVVTVLGTPLVAYAASKGWIGDDEVQLWSAEVAAAGTLAGANIVKRRRRRARRRRRQARRAARAGA